jgi:hypothetical protein
MGFELYYYLIRLWISFSLFLRSQRVFICLTLAGSCCGEALSTWVSDFSISHGFFLRVLGGVRLVNGVEGVTYRSIQLLETASSSLSVFVHIHAHMRACPFITGFWNHFYMYSPYAQVCMQYLSGK